MGLVDVFKGFFGDVVIQFLALVVEVVDAGSDFRGSGLFPDSTRPAALILGPMRKTMSFIVKSFPIPEKLSIVFSPRLGFLFNCNNPK